MVSPTSGAPTSGLLPEKSSWRLTAPVWEPFTTWLHGLDESSCLGARLDGTLNSSSRGGFFQNTEIRQTM